MPPQAQVETLGAAAGRLARSRVLGQAKDLVTSTLGATQGGVRRCIGVPLRASRLVVRRPCPSATSYGGRGGDGFPRRSKGDENGISCKEGDEA